MYQGNKQFGIFHLESRSLHQKVQFERKFVLFRASPDISGSLRQYSVSVARTPNMSQGLLKRDHYAQCRQNRQQRLFINLTCEQRTRVVVSYLTERILVKVGSIVQI